MVAVVIPFNLKINGVVRAVGSVSSEMSDLSQDLHDALESTVPVVYVNTDPDDYDENPASKEVIDKLIENCEALQDSIYEYKLDLATSPDCIEVEYKPHVFVEEQQHDTFEIVNTFKKALVFSNHHSYDNINNIIFIDTLDIDTTKPLLDQVNSFMFERNYQRDNGILIELTFEEWNKIYKDGLGDLTIQAEFEDFNNTFYIKTNCHVPFIIGLLFV